MEKILDEDIEGVKKSIKDADTKDLKLVSVLIEEELERRGES